jgi:thioredoxin reductase (NADPH)
MDKQLDLMIIGAGPAGLSAADAARREGLDYLVIEKGVIANTIHSYPIGRLVFSTPNELEIEPGSLKPIREKPTREELLSYYIHFALDRDLRINAGETVVSIERVDPEGFIVHTERKTLNAQTAHATYHARRILFAIGAMDHPRRLNIPGEDLPKVHHRFVEPYPYVRKEAMVIGGGNSAAEAALFLSEEGVYTTLCIWQSDWENRDPKAGAMKHWVRTPLEREVNEGRLRVVLFDHVEEITEGDVRVVTEAGEQLTLPNDVVFVLIGSDADLSLLRQIGVKTEQGKTAEVPVYNPETFETNVPGIYVAGHFTNERHILKAIEVPRRLVRLIAEGLRARLFP